MSGKWKSRNEYYISSYPHDFTKGIGKKGMQNLLKFINAGGIVISWGNSTDLFMGTLNIEHSKDNKEEFRLPVNNISQSLQKDGLYIPGSLVKLNLKKNHPLTYGMRKEAGAFYRGRPVFSTSLPNFDMDRRVIGTFPETDILMSFS